MNHLTSLYFPLDNLISGKIENKYKDDCIIESDLGKSKVDFDEIKGSFLDIRSNDYIQFDFPECPILNDDSSYIINFFFNYNRDIDLPLDLLIINKVLIFDIDNNNEIGINNSERIKVNENQWYNASIVITQQDTKLYLYDIQVLSFASSAIKDFEVLQQIIIRGKPNSEVKFSDLYIQYVDQYENLRKIINNQKPVNNTIANEVKCFLYNNQNKNELYIDENLNPVQLDIDFGNLMADFDQSQEFHAMLKVKKGFFNVLTEEVNNATTEKRGDEFCYKFKIENTADKRNFTSQLPELELVNLAGQDQVFIQLEFFNLTLNKQDIKKEIGEKLPLRLDKSIPIIDKRGKNECPFDLFVLGNNTLLNIDGNSPQSIKLRLINKTETTITLQNNPSTMFWINSSQIGILKKDSLQNADIILSQGTVSKGKDLCISITSKIEIGSYAWIDMTINGLIANITSFEYPSGEYPFDLEYKNITGYRSGKARFVIKTGRIFYT